MSALQLTAAESRLLELLRRQRALTASEAARLLALSVPTVTAQLRSLANAGLVRADSYAESSGGRRPLRYTFQPGAVLAVGVAVWPGTIQVLTCDLDLVTLHSRSSALPGPLSAQRLRRAVVDRVEQELAWLAQSRSTAAADPIGVGVSLPGVVDTERGVLVVAPNLFMSGVLLSEFGLPLPVLFENEANAAALGETYCRQRPRGESLAFVSVSHGVGVGIVFDGRLHRGASWRAGEFGHVAIPGGRRRCNCGRSGCWEQYASQTALLRRFGGRGAARMERFLQALNANSTAADSSLERYLDHFSLGLQNVVSCLDPDEIVIGGAVSAIGEPLSEGLRRRLSAAPMVSPAPLIRLSRLGLQASALGAAALHLRRLFE